MKHTKLFVFLSIFLFLFMLTNLYGQEKFIMGANLNLGFPQGEFKENVEQIGLGATGYFGFIFPNSPIILGGSVSFIIYGSETREEPWSETIPDVYVDVTTTNSIIMAHIFLRIQQTKGFFQPYIEGLIGLSYFTTDTRVTDQGDYEDIASSNNLSDITFSYGFCTGLMIRVWEKTYEKDSDYYRPSDSRMKTIFIDIGARYLKGGEAQYLKEGAIHIEDSDVKYDISKSTTDIFIPYIGVAFQF